MGERKYKACKYCKADTSNADGVCSHCRDKLILIRKIRRIGDELRRQADMEKALRHALWMRGGGKNG